LTGELDSHKKRLSELEKKCKAEFDCKIDELPAIITSFETEAQRTKEEAEVILGLREASGEQATEAVAEPIEETQEAVQEVASDEDALV